MSDKREGKEFPSVSCVFSVTKVKCYVSVQVTYLLDIYIYTHTHTYTLKRKV